MSERTSTPSLTFAVDAADPAALSAWLRIVDDFESKMDELSRLTSTECLILARSARPAIARAVMMSLSDRAVRSLISSLTADQLATVLNWVPDQRVTQLLRQSCDRDRTAALAALEPTRRNALQEMLSWREGSVGASMVPDIAAFPGSAAVQDVPRMLRDVERRGRGPLVRGLIYVVDDAGRLVGEVSFRDLLVATGTSRLIDVAQRAELSVRATDEENHAAHLLTTHRLSALPVIAEDERLVGMFTSECLPDEDRRDPHGSSDAEAHESSLWHLWLLLRTLSD